MDKLSFELEYKNETNYTDNKYRSVFETICSRSNEMVEVDVEEEFLAGRLIEIERPAFPSWKEDSADIDNYFGDIVQFFNTVKEDNTGDGAIGRDQLERWLTVKSCKINDTNSYLMAPCHPVVRLIDKDRARLERKYNESIEKDGSDISKAIKKSVLRDYLRRMENFYVYGTGRVYLSKRADGCRRAIPWDDVGTLTSLSSLRLLEKIQSWVRRNFKEESGQDSEVRIAYIGTIDDPEKLQEYCNTIPLTINEKNVNVKVSLTQLTRMPQSGKYVFRRSDCVQEGKRIFDLSSLADMKELFGKFNIVLFMDESYFYKQGQKRKDLSEERIAEYVQWCQKELEWELNTRKLTEDKAESRKSYLYREIYNKAGLWMNGYGGDETARLGFDKDLFGTIEQAAENADCDIYLYISLGETVGNVKLANRSVCNDERYAGKKLLVYQMDNQSHGEADVDSLVKTMLQENDILADIDLWKLVKSIGSEFGDYFFMLWGAQQGEICRGIDVLRHSYLLVSVADSSEQKPELQFSLYLPHGFQQAESEFLSEFVTSYLAMCSGDNDSDISYIKNYLYDLLVNSVRSRANTVEGIFYAYLMERKCVTIKDKIGVVYEKANGNDSIRYQARRAVYSAIRELDQIVIRDMEKRWDTLNYEFRYLYCRDIEEDTFRMLVDKVNRYCKKAGYTDSKLYLLTGSERDRYGK